MHGLKKLYLFWHTKLKTNIDVIFDNNDDNDDNDDDNKDDGDGDCDGDGDGDGGDGDCDGDDDGAGIRVMVMVIVIVMRVMVMVMIMLVLTQELTLKVLGPNSARSWEIMLTTGGWLGGQQVIIVVSWSITNI